ncbi:MAG: hypothetical protein ABSB84_03655 [Verrucomicrobiota bacterium]
MGKIKNLILAFGFVASSCTNAQISPVIDRYYHSQELMPFAVNTNDLSWKFAPIMPFRKVDSGKIIDFTLPINAQRSGWLIPHWSDDYFINGKVLSIIDDGILVKLDEPSLNQGNVVFLKNYPHQKTAIDGDPIFDIAYPSTNYTCKYTTVQGNEATVRCYDYGEIVVPNKVPFDVVRITPVGEIAVTITNLSTAKFGEATITNKSVVVSNISQTVSGTNSVNR